jgi:YD repeat-containing protein
MLLSIWGAAALPDHAQAAPAPQGETRLACLPWPSGSDCLGDPRPPLATDGAINEHLEDDRAAGCASGGPHPDHGCKWEGERSCFEGPFNGTGTGWCTRRYWIKAGLTGAYETISCNYSGDMWMIEYNRCTCPEGRYLNEETRRCEDDPWLPDRSCTVGHPVSPATGAKVKDQIDYTGAGAAPLSFIRSYNSDPRMGWTHNWAKRLDLFGHPFVIWAYRGSSSRMAFTDQDYAATADAYQPVQPGRDRLSNTLDANGNISGWTLRIFEDDSREHYDAYGRLLSVEMRNGWRYTLTYKGGRLDKVTNPFGRSLGFRYNADGRLSRLIDPAGGEIAYGYDGRGNPNRVTWQDKKFRRYHYEDKRFPELLTGITDEAEVRVETYSYDDQRRVKETSLAGGVDRLTFDYTGSSGNPQTVVTQYTEAGSTSSTYGFTRPANGLAWAPSSITAPCSLCGNTQANTTYDSAGRVFKAVAHDDTPTFYQYDDANGRETERATFPASFQLAFTRPALEEATRVVSTRWHATWNLPREVAEPNKITEYGYDGNGNLKSESWSATTDATGAATFDAVKTGSSFEEIYEHTTNNLLKTRRSLIDGAVVAHMNYELDNTKGIASRAINVLTGVTSGDAIYDKHGRLAEETDVYGTVKRKFTLRGLMREDSDGEATTQITHNAIGLVETVDTGTGLLYEWKYTPGQQVKSVTLTGQPTSLGQDANEAVATRLSAAHPEQSSTLPRPGGIGIRGSGWVGIGVLMWEIGKRIADSGASDEATSEEENCDPCKDPSKTPSWTPHRYKHLPDKGKSWAEIRRETGEKDNPAKYHPAVIPNTTVQQAFEYDVWQKGKVIKNTSSQTHKVVRFGYVIGAYSGKDTTCAIVRCSGREIHGLPADPADCDLPAVPYP